MIHYEYYFFLPSLYIINNGCLFNKKKWPAPKGAKCDSFSFNFLKHTILLHILSLAISTEFRNQVRIPTSLLSCAGCNIILRSCNNPNVMTCYLIYVFFSACICPMQLDMCWHGSEYMMNPHFRFEVRSSATSPTLIEW